MQQNIESRPISRIVLFLLCALGFFSIGAYFMFISLDNRPILIHRIFKTAPCLILALWVFLDKTPSLFSRFAVVALVFTAIGDWLLVGRDDLSFLLGIAANLLAHIWYIIGFSFQFRSLKPFRAIFPIFFVAALFLFFLRPHVEGVMKWAVALYSLIIAIMAWRASAAIGTSGKGKRYEILLFAGALLFMSCDTLISIDRFVVSIPNPEYWIMSCYWGGQFLIAYSVINLRKDNLPDEKKEKSGGIIRPVYP